MDYSFVDEFAYPAEAYGFRIHDRRGVTTMANEPRDQRPEIRLSQLSHGAG